jgi:single-stranded-DNA-specific exonuclease
MHSSTAQAISQKLKLSELFSRLLVQRGFDTPEKAERFIKSGVHNLHDPFLLEGMGEATRKIKKHIGEKRPIVIYGDYDADGICGVSILYLYLKSLGAEVYWYVPERDEGYGINAEAVGFIKASYDPSLFISVDCGITAAAEVEYIRSLGMDVIVTDHHNSTGNLPDCAVINPKLSRSYPFKDLCGAGVALKLVQALGGADEAKKYIDIAAIATVADSVELLGENRDIVAEGIKIMNTMPRPAVAKLCELAGFKEWINTYALAFGIVPRINAAGRVGEAKRAVSLFCEEGEEALDELCRQLDEANAERQRICDEIFSAAKEQIESEGMLSRCVIAVIDGSCHDGVSGIVASRLCEQFCRPSFVFCECEGKLKGSGRSIDGVNIFKMLSQMSGLFERFGGHACAAGLTMRKENFDEFVKRADEYLSRAISPRLFSRKKGYDMDLTGERPGRDFFEQLGLFEPCGTGNPRPRFLYRAKRLGAEPMKNYEQHLVFKLFGTGFVAFGYGRYREVLNADAESGLLIEFQQSAFKGKVYTKGYLKDLEYGADCPSLEGKAMANYLLQLRLPEEPPVSFKLYDSDKINELIGERVNPFGTLIIAFSRQTLAHLLESCPKLEQVKLSLFFEGDGNNLSRILLAPDPKIRAKGYKKVILADSPLKNCYINRLAGDGCEVYLPEKKPLKLAGKLSLDREVFARYFRMMTDRRALAKPFEGVSQYYYSVSALFPDVQLPQFAACFMVFEELGFIRVADGKMERVDGAKGKLSDSRIYRMMKALVE